MRYQQFQVIGLASLCIFAFSCTNEVATHDAPEPVATKVLQPQQILDTAHRLAARDRVLATRLARRGWSAGRDGITSSAWTRSVAPGREQIASRVPALADGTWETKVAGSEQLSVALRVERAEPSSAELLDGRVIYRDTFPGTHTLFSTDDHEAELNFMLLDERAPNDFTFAIDANGSELEARQDPGQQIAFVDRRGRTRLLMGSPHAIDAAGQTRVAQLSLEGERVRMRFDPTGMQYPILLDPPLGTPTWTQASPSTSPSARAYYGLATLGSKVVMFGGRLQNGDNTDETWEWDGSSWAQKLPASKPSARQPWTQMAALGDAVVLFSGLGSGKTDTWSWNGTNWSQLAPAQSPPFRAGGHLAAVSDKLILFGGSDESGVHQNDMWTWDGSNWTDNGTSGNPPARSYASVATFNNQILLFGGIGPTDSLSDTWGYDGSSWSLLSAAGKGPSARIRAPLGALKNSAVLFGGQDGTPRSDTWEWDGATWTERSPLKAPGGRFGAQFASLDGNVVTFGGYGEGTALSDTWTYTAIPLAVNGTSCTAAEQCESGFCTDGYCCNAACAGGSTDCQACNVAGQLGTCSNLGASTVCRAAADLCDAAESCTGSSATCPSDGVKAAGETCRIAAGDCDVAETCNGSSAACPADDKLPSTVTCRISAGDCDLAEMCTGTTDACPADAKRGSGTSCTDDGNPCSLDVCDGTGNACTHPAGNSGTECRAATGECDVAESCTGSSTSCPSDGVAASGVTCRTSTGECDPAEACDGSAKLCPSDLLAAADTPCTADADVCTRDVCNGSSAACTHPAGNAGTTCRAVAGDCDVAEVCDGASAGCPADQYLGSSVSCRDASCSSGVQVLAAVCAGTGPNCPAAVNEPCAAYSCGLNACHSSCDDADQCAPNHFCADDDTCQEQLNPGAACTDSAQCLSGFCVDGVCCNRACTGQCEACDVANLAGTCSPVPADEQPHGSREACDTDGTACGGSCDGDDRTSCKYPGSDEVCRVASCSAGVATLEATCGGDGSCGPLLTNDCAPYICGATACNGDCAIDTDCADGNFCFGGQCERKLVRGASCTAANQCQSGKCIDDMCCTADCDGQCEACDVVGFEGLCTAVVGDPHGARAACAKDGSVCDGSCNGTDRTACSYPASNENCRLGACSAGVATVAAFCDGAGACPALETRSCEPYVCGADACLGDCAEDADCMSGSFCQANMCTPKRALGETCGGNNACGSGYCVDGVCCNDACLDQCEACDVPSNEGTCTAVVGAPHGARPACDTDGSACGGACDGSNEGSCVYPGSETQCRSAGCSDGAATLAANCLGNGACPTAQQQACSPFICGETQCAGDCVDSLGCATGNYCSGGVCVPKLDQGESCGANEQCESDLCVDGYCCSTACEGQCEACDVAGQLGTCSAVTGAPHGGRAACAGVGACAGSCDGVESQACTYPGSSLTCATAACSAGIATRAASCNGQGGCQTATQHNCSPYTCGATDCRSTCSQDADCVTGYVCIDGQCTTPPAVDGGAPDSGPEPTQPDASTVEPDAGQPSADAGADASTPTEPIDPDLDSDRDGIKDLDELGVNGEEIDSDGDGVPNHLDEDDDGDSIPTRLERGRSKGTNDLDRDGVPNHLDRDADGDGVDDEEEAQGDIDGDGIPDYKDPPRLGVAGGALCSVGLGAGTGGAGGVAWLLLAAAGCLWCGRRRRRTTSGGRAPAARGGR